MPITPLHIGIPGIISHYFPRKVDIIGALIGAVIIDIDFFIFLLLDTPVHGFLHSFLGALIISIILIIVIIYFKDPMYKLKEWFKWDPESNIISISSGVLIGTYSHIIMDALIYEDMSPFYPLKRNILFIDDSMIIFIIYVISFFTTAIFIALYYNSIRNEKKFDSGQ